MSIPAVKARLVEGRKGLIVGIANNRSIAWGCARAFRAFGAEVAITYLNDKAKPHVEPLARLEAPIPAVGRSRARPGRDGVRTYFGDRGRARFPRALDCLLSEGCARWTRKRRASRGISDDHEISCWSFIRMAHLAEPLIKRGGAFFTMTYHGSQVVVENYNIMGVAKAALESAVRYVATELGPKGIRVPAISPGALATRAASGIPEFDSLLERQR